MRLSSHPVLVLLLLVQRGSDVDVQRASLSEAQRPTLGELTSLRKSPLEWRKHLLAANEVFVVATATAETVKSLPVVPPQNNCQLFKSNRHGVGSAEYPWEYQLVAARLPSSTWMQWSNVSHALRNMTDEELARFFTSVWENYSFLAVNCSFLPLSRRAFSAPMRMAMDEQDPLWIVGACLFASTLLCTFLWQRTRHKKLPPWLVKLGRTLCIPPLAVTRGINRIMESVQRCLSTVGKNKMIAARKDCNVKEQLGKEVEVKSASVSISVETPKKPPSIPRRKKKKNKGGRSWNPALRALLSAPSVNGKLKKPVPVISSSLMPVSQTWEIDFVSHKESESDQCKKRSSSYSRSYSRRGSTSGCSPCSSRTYSPERSEGSYPDASLTFVDDVFCASVESTGTLPIEVLSGSDDTSDKSVDSLFGLFPSGEFPSEDNSKGAAGGPLMHIERGVEGTDDPAVNAPSGMVWVIRAGYKGFVLGQPVSSLVEATDPVWLKRCNDQIGSFCDSLSPKSLSFARRRKLVALATLAVRRLWPNAKVDTIGSFATGIFLPESDIDLVVMGDVSAGKDKLRPLFTLAKEFEESRLAQRGSVNVISAAKIPVIKFVSQGGIGVDVTFNVRGGPENANRVRQELSDLPSLLPLTLYLKTFLRSRGLNDVFTGGLSSHALVLLVIHSLRHQARHGFADAPFVVQLLYFFEMFGGLRFDFKNVVSIDAPVDDPPSKEELGWLVEDHPLSFAIQDPHSKANVSVGSFRYQQLQAEFMAGYQSLAMWLAMKPSAAQQPAA